MALFCAVKLVFSYPSHNRMATKTYMIARTGAVNRPPMMGMGGRMSPLSGGRAGHSPRRAKLRAAAGSPEALTASTALRDASAQHRVSLRMHAARRRPGA
eukprot:CAMPEP_0181353546 /NCGR_PEP_ID=MMETSP1106-20121128/2889_1 /TAXON_ID=81844 /ORGANISM="Mantoniella antarctica, Strain SL-175" /LENGTH=99 /DNA_ID=CAMNT_0023466157 /DNA_START=209 /DNA_END=509 /DNA_ORIENTATION=-